MKKVLFIVSDIRVSNGVTSVVMNYYPELKKNGYEVDFYAMYDKSSPWLEELKKCGSNYYLLPQTDETHSKPDYEKSKKFLEKQFGSEKYDIVHIHITGKYAALTAKLAKRNHVPYRIYHAHNPLYIHDVHSALYTLAYHIPSVYNCNRFLACSMYAGKSYFKGRKFEIIKNTIDTDNLRFDGECRKCTRKKIGLNDTTIVIGTVCRQAQQKNPFFIVDIFEEYHKINSDSVLMWVGTGELEQEVKKYIEDKKLNKIVIFMGNQTDMKSMYSAMDIFLLPSLFEGLGIVFIEAQAAGLPSYASYVVPEDTKVTDLIHYISLKKDAKAWACELELGQRSICEKKRSQFADIVESHGYGKRRNHDLLKYYETLFEKEER